MDVTLTQLRYFTEAAARLSMTAASVRLNVAQSAVSTAVAQLERAVGAQFFIRQRSKGLVLTPAGEMFLKDAQALLVQLEDALDRAREEQVTLEGNVRLVCFATLAPFLLPGLLSRLSQMHSGLNIEVTEADAAGCASALMSGQAELAICYDYGLPEGVRTSQVDTTRPYVALPSGHPLATRDSVDLQLLAEEPFVLLDLPHTRELMLGILAGAGLDPVVHFRSGSFETVRTFVANGHGFSILHQRPRHDLAYDGGRVAAVPIDGPVPELRTVVAHLGTQRTTARMKAVIQALRGQIQSQGTAADMGRII